jgi:hypothetical protein
MEKLYDVCGIIILRKSFTFASSQGAQIQVVKSLHRTGGSPAEDLLQVGCASRKPFCGKEAPAVVECIAILNQT